MRLRPGLRPVPASAYRLDLAPEDTGPAGPATDRPDTDEGATADSAGSAVGQRHGADTAAPESARASEPVLTVADLTVTFPTADGVVTAARGLSYEVRTGEVLAIVGESGSGKSVASLAVLGLLPRTARVSGSVRFRGQELLGLDDRRMSSYRGGHIAMVFQDPMTSLNPVHPVGRQLAEAVTAHQEIGRRAAAARAVELLRLVGIPQPERRARAYPHEFSGGMRQRVVIAMAMANDPDVIIADEPTTALDVTVQAQVLDVLATARERTRAAMVLITHDLGVVAGQADRVLVMYAGRAVEVGDVHTLFAAPRMPYTLGLLGSLPRIDGGPRTRLVPIGGAPPSLIGLPVGCPFAPRCPLATSVCHRVEPALRPVGAPGHQAACHHADHLANAAPGDVFGPDARIGPPQEDPDAPVIGTVNTGAGPLTSQGSHR